ELMPVMEAVGSEEEIAALSLGASGWQLFWRVTVPNIKWGLVYGVILCNARAMGEFGAVYVVSGHIAGKTDTMPLRVEKIFQEYNLPGSFPLASLLTLLALVTLLVKVGLERKMRNDAAKALQSTSEAVAELAPASRILSTDPAPLWWMHSSTHRAVGWSTEEPRERNPYEYRGSESH